MLYSGVHVGTNAGASTDNVAAGVVGIGDVGICIVGTVAVGSPGAVDTGAVTCSNASQNAVIDAAADTNWLNASSIGALGHPDISAVLRAAV